MDEETRAFLAGANDAVRRVIAELRQKAAAAEELRSAQHRAFMAEQREALASMQRAIEEKLASVRDGRDGRDGLNGADGLPGRDGADGAPGCHGKDGTDGAPGRDGASVDPDTIRALVAEAVDATPRPQNGRDGKDGADGADGKAGAPGADGRDGADGIGLAGALIDQAGNLLVTLSNGSLHNLGPVVGRDGAAGADGAPGQDGVDGRDGTPGERGEKGEDGAAGRDAYPGEARGKYDPDGAYRAMDTVGHNGSEWRAKRDNPGPLPGDGWMLSACVGKRGERGERGPEGREGKTGSEIVAGYLEGSTIVLTRSDGGELKIDLPEEQRRA